MISRTLNCCWMAIVFWGSGIAAWAGIAPEHVAIVVNGDSEVSQRIAREYAQLRGVPEGNVISVTGLPDKEKLSVQDFRTKVLEPVLKTIEQRGLKPQIDLIAYSAEIPTAIDVSGDLGDRKLPKILTPIASINGLTFLHQWVLAKDPRYLDLNINPYARRVVAPTNDTPWTLEEQQRYADTLLKLQQWAQARAAKKDAEDNKSAPEEAPFQASLAIYDELLKTHPQSGDLNYNRACMLAQLEQLNAAMTALQAAVKTGWWDYRHAARDDDLKGLRARDDFKAVLEAMKNVDFEVQPSIGFRSVGWNVAPRRTTDESATKLESSPRYLLSTVLACTTGRGTTVDEALTHLRRSEAADGTRPKGTIYFERNGDVRSTTREWAFRNAARKLESLGVKAIVEDGVLPKDRADVAGAVIGIADFDWATSGSQMLPGAIVEHLTSFGGVMTKGAGQTPLTEFLKHGAAGASGAVTEPFAIQAKFPSPYLHVHYANGLTLAESFYQSVTGPYQLLIVGDPLCQPWRRHFALTLEGLPDDGNVSGDVVLTPKWESTDGITAAEFEIYVDGLRVLSTSKVEELRWRSQQHSNGEHVLTVIARGNDAVQTLARQSRTTQIQRHHRCCVVEDVAAGYRRLLAGLIQSS